MYLAESCDDDGTPTAGSPAGVEGHCPRVP